MQDADHVARPERTCGLRRRNLHFWRGQPTKWPMNDRVTVIDADIYAWSCGQSVSGLHIFPSQPAKTHEGLLQVGGVTCKSPSEKKNEKPVNEKKFLLILVVNFFGFILSSTSFLFFFFFFSLLYIPYINYSRWLTKMYVKH